MPTENWRRLRDACVIAAAVHLIAGLAMALILRHGLQSNPDLADRLRFLVERRGLWTAAWLTWNVAALSILWFFACVAEARPCGLTRFALALAAAGVAGDLSAETIEMALVPAFAAAGNAAALQTADRAAVLLTGYLANGLYTAASLASLAALWKDSAPLVRVSGVLVGIAGLWLSAAALADSTWGMLASNVLLVPAILGWQLGRARDAHRRALAGPSR